MFATKRRNSRNKRMKNELGLSVGHLKRAASLAAEETSATVGPKFNAALDRVQPAAVKAKDAASSSWDSALATITPLVTAASENVRKSGKVSKKAAKANKKNAQKLEKRANKALGRKQGKRKSKLFGYALLGTAVGVGAAYVVKRRQAAQWDEYDPATPISPQVSGAVDAAVSEPDKPVTYTSPNGTVTDPAPNTPR